MPRRHRGIDTRNLPKPTDDDGKEICKEVDIEASPTGRFAKVDVNAFCTACGVNDPAAFSNRMLYQKRGRHGERTRRCMQCVEKGHFATSDSSDAVFRPASVLHSCVSQLPAAAPADRWAAAELAREESARLYMAAAAAARRSQAVHAAQAAQRAQATEINGAEVTTTVQPSAGARGAAADAGVAETERKRKRLRKALRDIDELKQRRKCGESLEATQEAKLARESALRAELRSIEEGYVFLFEGDEAAGCKEADRSELLASTSHPSGDQKGETIACLLPGKAGATRESAEDAQPKKRPRLDPHACHKDATFASGGAGTKEAAQLRRKKLWRPAVPDGGLDLGFQFE